jgi:hypothetical protein
MFINWFKGLFDKQKNKALRDRILFISSPIISNRNTVETLDYFAAIVSGLSIGINTVLPKYDLVIKVPEGGEHALEKQMSVIEETINTLTANQNEYKAVIISPFDKSKIKEQVKKLCSLTSIYLIDQGYYNDHEMTFFRNSDIDPPPFCPI